MAKTLFIVNDDVFQGLPDPAQKKLLGELRDLFSFVPEFKVEARSPQQFPAVLHFTDSVVSLVEQDITIGPVFQDIRRKETANVQFSIKQEHLNLKIDTIPSSFDGDQEAMGIGGQWKTVIENGGKKIAISMMYGVASLESAEEAFLEELLKGRTAEDIRRERKNHKDPKWVTTADGQQSTRDLAEAELLSKHKSLRDWPSDQWESVATALARIVAHEARHQYILEHSSAGLGTSAPRIWGDQKFETFDRTDQANILKQIKDLDTNWNTATVHLETCPSEKVSPFSQ